MQYQCKNPVVLIVFNRPEKTLKLLEKVATVTPDRVFVIADGPRQNHPSDNEKCSQVRNLIEEKIRWECEITKIYSEKNLRGPNRVPSGFKEVFQSVEQAIILEDDCIPTLSFFKYCDILLDRFKMDHRIGTIGGTNSHFDFFGNPVKTKCKESYFFSTIPSIWGWATWRRVWDQFDNDMQQFPNLNQREYVQSVTPHKYGQKYLMTLFGKIYNGKRNHWDYKLFYSLIVNRQLSVIPKVNLVENIGFDQQGSNFKHKTYYEKKKSGTIAFPLIHPTIYQPHAIYDKAVFKHYFTSNKWHKLLRILRNYFS